MRRPTSFRDKPISQEGDPSDTRVDGAYIALYVCHFCAIRANREKSRRPKKQVCATLDSALKVGKYSSFTLSPTKEVYGS
jgi:hypothetical protein